MTKLDDIRDRLIQRQIDLWLSRKTLHGRLWFIGIVVLGVACLFRWLMDHGWI